MNKKQGFTLIELLVVIAIIAILSSIVFTSLGGTRIKSRINAVRESLSTVKNAVFSCIQEDGDMTTPISGEFICSPSTDSSHVWPPLPTNWSYVTADITTNGGVLIPAPVSSFVAETFRFDAVGDGVVLTCTKTGCALQQE